MSTAAMEIDDERDDTTGDAEAAAEDSTHGETPRGKRRRKSAPAAVPAPAPAANSTLGPTGALRDIKSRDDETLRDWLEGLSSEHGAFSIQVTRTRPAMHRGVLVKGSLGRYDEPIDEERIREDHGGGEFLLRFNRRTDKGNRYVTARSITIPGDPRIDTLVGRDSSEPAAAAATPTHDPLVAKVVDATIQRSRELEERLSQQQQRPAAAAGLDPALIDSLIAPYRLQLEASERRMQALEAKLAGESNSPERHAQSKLLDKLIDGDSARIEALRTRHESELRQIKENAREDEKRLIAANERDRSAMQQAHQQQLADLRQSHEMVLASMRSSADVEKAMLRSQVATLERELGNAQKELIELRAKKDKPLLEQFKEIELIKETLGVGKEDEDEATKGHWLERAIGKLVDSKVASVVVDRVMGDPQQAAAAAQQQQQLAQSQQLVPGQPFRDAQGKIWVFDGTNVVPMPLKKRKKGAAPEAPADGAPPAEEGVEAPPEAPVELPTLDPEDTAKALAFLEAAFRGGQDPVAVAQAVQTMVPGDILGAVQRHGVDLFLDKMAGLERGSPFSTQAGRNWARKLGKALTGG